MEIRQFEKRVMPEPNSGCWIWIGKTEKAGYGRIGNSKRAHRVAYELYIGPIPCGKMVCHRCDLRCCVNPQHLFAGTGHDNMRDAAAKKRLPGRKPPSRGPTTKKKFHCNNFFVDRDFDELF